MQMLRGWATKIAGWAKWPAVAGLCGLLIWVLWETHMQDNLGFGGKSLWDWLHLLIVPIGLACAVLLSDWLKHKTDRDFQTWLARIEEENVERRSGQDALVAYLDQMSEHWLGDGLRLLRTEPTLRTMVSIRTQEALRKVDRRGKGTILRALGKAGLIEKDDAIVTLRAADLNQAELAEARLSGVDLREASLVGAKLDGAILTDANLGGAQMVGAQLVGAKLVNANLREAKLMAARLISAELDGADFAGADLTAANLRDAIISDEQRLMAAELSGATMPDGTKYDDWAKRRAEDE